MADTNMAIPAIPADLRGKEKPIPAGYLHETKGSAGIAGIRTNTNTREGKYVMSHMRVCTWEIRSTGGYPRYPRRVIVFKHLTCGDRPRLPRLPLRLAGGAPQKEGEKAKR
jgi:hypothetical protein